jgi:integrase
MAGKRRGNSEGTITERADGRWEARYSDAAGKRRCIYGKTRAEVAGRLAAAIRDRDKGLLLADGKMTVEAYLTSWLETMRPPRVRESTWMRYEIHMRLHVIPAIGQVKLQQLNRMHLQQLYARCQAHGLAASTTKQLHVALHQALKDAMRSDLVMRNVADLADPPRAQKREMMIYTPEQVDTLLTSAAGHRLFALVALTVASGMRAGELLSLKWRDVDLSCAVVHVKRTRSRVAKGYVDEHPKTSAGRRDIKLIPLALDALRAHKRAQGLERLRLGEAWQDQDRVFPSSIGTAMNGPNLDKHWHRITARARLPEIHFHDLRHSAASWLISHGVPIPEVSELLGHSGADITSRIYAHTLPGSQDRVAAALQQILQRPSPSVTPAVPGQDDHAQRAEEQ